MADLIDRQAAIYFKVSHGIDEDGVLYVPYGEVKKYLEQLPSAQVKLDENDMPEQGDSAKFWVKTGETCTDCISRQAAIDAIFSEPLYESGMKKRDADAVVLAIYEKIKSLPSTQPEPLTDKEQRIFLAAMTREEKVCKKVDAEMSGEQYEDILVRVCREIVRKVKGALWT